MGSIEKAGAGRTGSREKKNRRLSVIGVNRKSGRGTYGIW